MAMNIDAAVNISADVSGQQAVDKLSESLKKLGDTGQLSAAQIQQSMRYLPKQFDDAFRSLAAGQAPMNVLLTQGSQLRDMFGGVVPAVRAVGTMLGGMINPLTVAIAAMATFAYAAHKGSSESAALANQLSLTGGAAGYTAGQIEKMAETLRDTAGISAGTARDLSTGLAASGQFVGKSLDEAAQAAAKVQKLTGQSSDEIIKDFSAMSKGVAAWAAEHNRQFNYLSVAQFNHIKQLENMGDKEGAIKANIEALNAAFEDRQKRLGYLEQGWEKLGKMASWAWDKMLGVGREKSDEGKLDDLQKRAAELGEQLAKALSKTNTSPIFAKRIQAELDAVNKQIADQQSVVDKAQKEAAAKSQAAAKVREKIEEEQSGKLAALQNANVQLQLERLKGASEQEIAVLEQKGQRIENQYRAGLISEEQYNAEKLRIAKDILNERMKLSEQEIAAEGKRPVNSKADAVQRETKLVQLRNQLAQLGAEATQAELKAEGERSAFLRQLNDEVAKFTRTQQTHIEQIKAEADAVDMSTLDYKKHTEALRIDKEAADAAKGKSKEFVEAIKAEAEAQKDATNKALEYADAKSRSFESGAKAAMKDYVESTANAANQAKTLFSNAFKGMEDALVNFVKTGKMDFASLADSIISDMIRIAIQAQITKPLAAAMGSSDFGSSIAGMFGFANGGIMTAGGPLPLKTYANGGIANSPQMAIFGEGKTPEAFVPLPDGRHIPVAMQGGGGGSNVVVNVMNNASNAKATAQERQDANGQRVIDVFIEQVKASIAGDISRGVGTVTSALERTYGANRAAGAY